MSRGTQRERHRRALMPRSIVARASSVWSDGVAVIALDWVEVSRTCQQASPRAAELIRSAPRADAAVPGMEWTVADVAAHLVSLTTRYLPFVQDIVRPAFDSMPDLNAQELAPLTSRSLAKLADDLERHSRASCVVPIWRCSRALLRHRVGLLNCYRTARRGARPHSVDIARAIADAATACPSPG